MSMIPSGFKNAVVAIGEVKADGSRCWFGSGFLVGKRDQQDPKITGVFLITNKHVAEVCDKIQILFNKKDGSGTIDLSRTLRDGDKKNYTDHPDKNVDIVACVLNGALLENVSSLNWFDLEVNALTLKEMQDTGVDEGCLVYALGFPMGIVANSFKSPFLRLGCISRISDTFCGGSGVYYVDAQSFPGNSGGPIVSRPEIVGVGKTKYNNKSHLIGILNSHIPYHDYLVSQQTHETVMLHYENSGLVKVFPVDRIKEVVDLEENRAFGATVAAKT